MFEGKLRDLQIPESDDDSKYKKCYNFDTVCYKDKYSKKWF